MTRKMGADFGQLNVHLYVGDDIIALDLERDVLRAQVLDASLPSSTGWVTTVAQRTRNYFSLAVVPFGTELLTHAGDIS